MLEEYVHHYLEEGSRSLTHLPTYLQWWTNPYHALGILGGMYFASRKDLTKKATMGIAASAFSVIWPELSDILENASKSPDYTPLFASFMTSFVATSPFLAYNLARLEWDEYLEKGYVDGSQTLTSIFGFLKEHPRVFPFAIQKISEQVTNGKKGIEHTFQNVTQSAHMPGKALTRSLLTVGAAASTYLLYRVYQTTDLPFVSNHLLTDTLSLMKEHPAITAGIALSVVTGYLQKPYQQFAAWSGVAAVPALGALQCMFNSSYTFADYGNDMFIGMPLAFVAHVAGRGIKSIQQRLFSK